MPKLEALRRHLRRKLVASTAFALTSLWTVAPIAAAEPEPIRIGLILPMTGPFQSTGRQIDAAVRLYLAQAGSTVAGRKIEVLLKDDSGVADNTRRIAQELIVNDKVAVIAGFGITPCALAVGSVASQSRTPAVIMAAATSSIVATSPYFVRTSYALPQTATAMADWARREKIDKVVTLVSDYGPGLDAEKSFSERFAQSGGKVLDALRIPVRNPDFAPFLQRVRDAAPQAVYVFVPSGPGAALMKQFDERGMGAAGIRLIGDGPVTDDDQLNDMGDPALGVVTAFHYSAAHDSAENRAFVGAFRAANGGMRPNFMAIGGYDGMRVIMKALEATKGEARNDALVAAMAGQQFESPRGPVLIDPQTRDIVQNVYIRRVERRDGELYNVEIESIKATDAGAKR